MSVHFFFNLGILILLSSCQFLYQEKPQKGLLNVDSVNLSYQMVRDKVFTPKCISCHGNSGGVSLESYKMVKANIGGIEKAALISRTMPKNGPLNQEEASLLSAWIKAGAPENSAGPPIPEEPLVPTFVSIKNKIFIPRCLGCHSANGNASGVLLGDYTNLMKSPRDLVLPGNYEESGLFIAVTRPDTDDKRMPPPRAGNALSSQEIETIKKWIELGAPEK